MTDVAKPADGNPLTTLATEGTLWMPATIAIAYAVSVLRIEWFFPAMLLIIGGRYLTFHSLYGLRVYWVLGGVLCACGLGLGLLKPAPHIAALAGAGCEAAFALLIFRGARR